MITPPTASEWVGYSTKWGILTPTRSPQILDQKFAVAYMYGQDIEKVLVANTTHQPLIIKAGTQLAEFHPRGGSAYVFDSEYDPKVEKEENETESNRDNNEKDNELKEIEKYNELKVGEKKSEVRKRARESELECGE